jgi:hypothetical protein
MISRRTTKYLAELYVQWFRHSHGRSQNRGYFYSIVGDEFYDFLFEHEYDDWFCTLGRTTSSGTNTRQLIDFILGLHTGETLKQVAPDGTGPQQTSLGQDLLTKLAGDILKHIEKNSSTYPPAYLQSQIADLMSSLQLDGYKYQDSRLLISESEVFDTQDSTDILSTLYKELDLDNSEIAFNHLKLSEEAFLAKRWGDCISNSRNLLETVLREVAASHSVTFDNTKLDRKTYETPVLVRQYLENIKLIEENEKKTLAEVYGLLSNTGSHPYMAQQDQARLLRHVSLLLSEFIMLRYQGELANSI